MNNINVYDLIYIAIFSFGVFTGNFLYHTFVSDDIQKGCAVGCIAAALCCITLCITKLLFNIPNISED